MKLSVIIVSRNACLLLKQAINTLLEACENIHHEIFIVDNGSTDHTIDMLENNFPDLRVIANDTDAGIAKANNQALEFCTGEYVLMVSADTITIRDSVEKMIAFMDTHADAGGMGIRMLSPQGRFLPESIHGLTKTCGSFLKIIGFAKHLSKTRLYDRNRKDWVEEFQVAEVDILNRACMMVRRSALNETGVFDERFVRYGADIDLSYRLRLAGYKNYYYPKTYIISFAGDRPTRFNLDYIRYFYGSMFLFAFKYLIKVPEIKVKGIPQLFPPTYEVK
jgi:GT2 family glycosyltransferase